MDKCFIGEKSTHKTLFEEYLEECGIKYHRIQVATPRHNGKVERQHRLDEQRFTVKCECLALKMAESSLPNTTKFQIISQKLS